MRVSGERLCGGDEGARMAVMRMRSAVMCAAYDGRSSGADGTAAVMGARAGNAARGNRSIK